MDARTPQLKELLVHQKSAYAWDTDWRKLEFTNNARRYRGYIANMPDDSALTQARSTSDGDIHLPEMQRYLHLSWTCFGNLHIEFDMHQPAAWRGFCDHMAGEQAAGVGGSSADIRIPMQAYFLHQSGTTSPDLEHSFKTIALAMFPGNWDFTDVAATMQHVYDNYKGPMVYQNVIFHNAWLPKLDGGTFRFITFDGWMIPRKDWDEAYP